MVSFIEMMENGNSKSDMSDEQSKKIIEERENQKKEQKKFFSFFNGGDYLLFLVNLLGFSKKDEKKKILFDILKNDDLGLLSTAGKFICGLLARITNGISSIEGKITGSGISGLFKGLISSGTLSTIFAGACFTLGLLY